MDINRRTFLSAAVAGAAQRDPAKRPNIVVILADDFGYGSLNCYGADTRHIQTPNIDRLAREGVRFTDANTPSSVCTPSRYAVMTGRYCWRTSLRRGVLGILAPLHIETDRLTMASLVKSAGYRTAAIGKWHLGYGVEHTDYTAPLTPGPLDIGFDYHFAIPQNHCDATGVYVENRGVWGLRSRRLQPFGKTYYGSQFLGIDAPQRVDETVMEVLTGRAVDWLGKQQPDKPFFLYFTPVAVHEPVTPSVKTKGTSGAGPYGDWIHDLDLSVGRILKALDQNGLAKDTLVIFTSDNGAVVVSEGSSPQAEAYRKGLRANGNWRGRKHSIYQGGFRVPFLVRWPGRARAGTTCDETINLVDLLATTSAILGKPLPSRDVAAEDSHSALAAFLGQRDHRPLRDSMISHSADGVFAIRQGPWKYIEGKPDAGAKNSPAWVKVEFTPQLYNLEKDPSEQKNLLEDRRDIVARMSDLLSTQREAHYTRPK